MAQEKKEREEEEGSASGDDAELGRQNGEKL